MTVSPEAVIFLSRKILINCKLSQIIFTSYKNLFIIGM